MKKQIAIMLCLTLVLTAISIIPSSVAHTEEAPLEKTLYAGQDIDVGTVYVWNDVDSVHVEFETDEPWIIIATHLYVGKTNPEELTSAPGQFPYSEVPADDNSYDIPFTEICGWKLQLNKKDKPTGVWIKDDSIPADVGPDDTVYIAAHAVVVSPIDDCWEKVWQIGDVEVVNAGTGWLENYADEFNWEDPAGPITAGPSLAESEPEFADPFIVDINPTSEFPYNSNYARGYATDFDVQYDGWLPFGGRMTVSWSPGSSASEKKIISDGFPDQTLTATGSSQSGQGWFLDKYPLVEQSFVFDEYIPSGTHTINFQHTQGDGTFWDWILLEKPCEQWETAWGDGDDFPGANWATYFDYEIQAVPYFTQANLVTSTYGSTWNEAADPTYSDYAVELDCLEDWHYLDLDEVTVENGLLADEHYGFYLDPSSVPTDFYTYWTGRGVYDGCSAVEGWEPTMWEIITDDGPTLPMFYIKVYNSGIKYMLIDGLQYELYHQYSIGVEDNPLRVNGNYPTGVYTFTGEIKNTDEVTNDVTITIDFYRCCPCILDMSSNIEILTTPPEDIRVGALEDNDHIYVWKEFQGPLPADLYYDLAEGQNARDDGPAAPGTLYIEEGTPVCIYYVHLDGVGSTAILQKTAQITFGDDILGLIISGGNVGTFANRNLMFAADTQIGDSETTYPQMSGTDLLRGFDVHYNVNTDDAEFNGATVDFTMYVVNAHDSMRIILPCACCSE